MEVMIWLLLLLALAPSAGFAQSKTARQKRQPARKSAPAVAAPATKWPIQTLAVEGNQAYTSEQVLAIAGLKVGQMAGKDEFDAAHDRLLATGAFDTVGYKFEPKPDGKGYAASFQVAEAGVLPVRFHDLGVPDAELESVLRLNDPLFSLERLPTARQVIDRWTNRIREYLASKNLDNKIMGNVEPWPDQLAIVFRPARGLPAVAEVTFEGNRAVSQTALRDAVAGAAVGAPYTDGMFRAILEASIRPVYEAHGLLRVAFPQLRAEPAKDADGLSVFVTVSEGESYRFGNVEIAGPTPLPPGDLLRLCECKTGDLANFDRVKDGLASILKAARRAGYLDVQVKADRSVHDAEKTVDVALSVEAGPQYTMGKLEIVGLDLTAEAQIKRIWTIKEGKPFDPDYPDHFLKRVREDGVFDNLGATKSATQIDARKHTADVTLTFAGANPTQGAPNRRRRVGPP